MSKYKIYRSDFADAKRAGRKNRWMYAFFIVSIFFLTQIPNYTTVIPNPKIKLAIFMPLAVAIICIDILLFIRLKKMFRSLKNIGTLEITKTHLKKQIGDLTTTHEYAEISKIELENYFKGMSLRQDSYTRSLKIISRNLTEEIFIISNKSIDFQHKITISDSLNFLKKLTDIKIDIKNN